MKVSLSYDEVAIEVRIIKLCLMIMSARYPPHPRPEPVQGVLAASVPHTSAVHVIMALHWIRVTTGSIYLTQIVVNRGLQRPLQGGICEAAKW